MVGRPLNHTTVDQVIQACIHGGARPRKTAHVEGGIGRTARRSQHIGHDVSVDLHTPRVNRLPFHSGACSCSGGRVVVVVIDGGEVARVQAL